MLAKKVYCIFGIALIISTKFDVCNTIRKVTCFLEILKVWYKNNSNLFIRSHPPKELNFKILKNRERQCQRPILVHLAACGLSRLLKTEFVLGTFLKIFIGRVSSQ